MSDQPPILTRIVTSYGQWDYFGLWVDDDGLFQRGVEWVVLNDKPGDPCPQGLRAAFERRGVQRVEFPFNAGRSVRRNQGAAMARGAWVEHVDGDDWPLPVDIDAIAADTGSDVRIYDVVRHAFGEGFERTPLEPVTGHPADGAPARDWLLEYVTPARLMVRRGAFEAVGGYDARFEDNEDTHLLAKLVQWGARIQHVATAKQSYNDTPRTGYNPASRLPLLCGQTAALGYVRSHLGAQFGEAARGKLLAGHDERMAYLVHTAGALTAEHFEGRRELPQPHRDLIGSGLHHFAHAARQTLSLKQRFNIAKALFR